MNSQKLDIVVDFDGTCTSHDFPRIGKPIGSVPVLKELVAAGHRLILFTMRSDNSGQKVRTTHKELHPSGGPYLQEAVAWFERNGIELYGIQSNPGQHKWTSSPKAYGHLHIDDAALGCPLKVDEKVSHRPFVDWKKVRKQLVKQRILADKLPGSV